MRLDTVLGIARNNQYPVVATAEKDARRSEGPFAAESRLPSKGEFPVFLLPPCPAQLSFSSFSVLRFSQSRT